MAPCPLCRSDRTVRYSSQLYSAVAATVSACAHCGYIKEMHAETGIKTPPHPLLAALVEELWRRTRPYYREPSKKGRVYRLTAMQTEVASVDYLPSNLYPVMETLPSSNYDGPNRFRFDPRWLKSLTPYQAATRILAHEMRKYGRLDAFPATEVLALLHTLQSANLTIHLDGGWAVDAAAGKPTRPHSDLDLVLPTRELSTAIDVLATKGFKEVRRDCNYNVVLADVQGLELDLHTYDDQSSRKKRDTIYGPNGLPYRLSAFTGKGSILGIEVPMVNTKDQMATYEDHELDENGQADLEVLRSLG